MPTEVASDSVHVARAGSAPRRPVAPAGSSALADRPPPSDAARPVVSRRGRHSLPATVAALAGWAALVAVGRGWGLWLLARGRRLELAQPPLLGRPGPGWTIRLLAPLVVGLALMGALPWLAARWRWATTVVVAALASSAWAVSLAAVDGPRWASGLTRGVAGGNELGADVARVAADPSHFLRTFTRQIAGYHVQVRGHPPGMVLILVGLRDLGLGGNGWAAALLLGAGAASVAVVLVAARMVAGESAARQALPFLVLSPAAIWMATSPDAFYVLTCAVAVALTLAALGLPWSPTHDAGAAGEETGPGLDPRPSVRTDAWAVAAGLAWAGCLLLSYGLVLVALVPLVVAWRHRRVRPLVVTAGVAAAALAAFGLTGFWWPAGLLATRHQYDTLHVSRPLWYFGLADLSAWALALGPAMAVAVLRLPGWPRVHRRGGAGPEAGWTRSGRGLALVVAGGLAAALVADLSGMSEGEVERIWLPFTAWVLLAGVSLAARGPRRARAWLALQAASAVVLVSLVTTQW